MIVVELSGRGKFKVMAYAEPRVDPDEYEENEKEPSDTQLDQEFEYVDAPLATWFSICKMECEADRLRLFLNDAEKFCIKSFGNSKSTDEVEVQLVKTFLVEYPKYLNVAYSVKEAWPSVANEVARKFFELITQSIVDKYSEKKRLSYISWTAFFQRQRLALFMFREQELDAIRRS